MFLLLAELALEAGLFVYSRYRQLTADDVARDHRRADELSFPTAREGDPIPLFYGRVRHRSPNVIWRGGLHTEAVYQEVPIPLIGVQLRGPVSGYEYAIAFQMSLGIPGGTFAKIRSAYVNDKLVGFSLDGNTNIDQLHITGGGISGDASWYGGDLGDLPLAQNGGHFGWVNGWTSDPTAPSAALLPDYAGIANLAFFATNTGANNGWPLGMSPQPDAYSFELIADCAGAIDPTASLGAYLGAINGGDANPANVLWDLMTNPWGRGGIPTSMMHAQSFVDAGQVLAAEGNGFSMIFGDSRSLREAVRVVLDQIDGGLYIDPTDRLVHLRLVREDYTAGSLPIFDEGNIIAVEEWTTSTWEETPNQMTATFNDRDAAYTTRTVIETDDASISAQGKVTASAVSFPGVTNAAQAQVLCYRELRAASRPLRRLKMIVNRDAYLLRPNDLFRFSWAKYGVVLRVMRVSRIDLGTLRDGQISITATEDIFAVTSGTLTFPARPIVALTPATPITARVVDEAPWWLQHHARTNGEITDEDAQRLWYLAVAAANDLAVTPQISLDGGASFVDDVAAVPAFPATATASIDYARTLDPYDTVTGIDLVGLVYPDRIETGLVSGRITYAGHGLVRFGDEIIAFESFTDNGDGTGKIERIWRGLLDTAAVAHVAGERLYFLARTPWGLTPCRLSGMTFDVLDPEIVARLLPSSSSGRLTPATDQPTDAITIGRDDGFTRAARAYPVADLKIAKQGTATSKTPAALATAAIDLTWLSRARASTTITRGDAAAETTTADTTWDVRGTKLGLVPLAPALLRAIAHASLGGLGDPQAEWIPLGRAGHGAIDVAVRTQSDTGWSWQDPAITITAYHWRNLVSNGDFADALSQWSTVSGTPIASTASPPDTGGRYLIDNAFGANLEITETVDVAGYLADGMAAVLWFYGKNYNADSDDTLTASVEALDSAGAHLGTTATTTVTPSLTTWTRYELAYAALPAGTAALKVTIKATGVVGSGSDGTALDPDSACTNITLRVGRFTANLIANGTFEAGALTSWSTISGTFAAVATNPYAGGWCADATVAGTLRQDVTLTAGYEYGTAVLECARGEVGGSNTSHDTGEVKLIALDGSNVVIATATTGAEVIGSGNANAWARRELALVLPAATAKVRVDFVTGAHSALDWCAAIDDVVVRVHKALDPDQVIDLRFDEVPDQPMPRSAAQFAVAFPALASPGYGWDFAAARALIGDLEMTAGAHVKLDAKIVGPWSGDLERVTDTCVEFPADASAEDVATYANTTAMNFATAESFTAIAIVKMDGESNLAATRGILGRMSTGGKGWSLQLETGGNARAVLGGASSTKTATGAVVINDGAPHLVALVYDAGAALLHVIDEDGTDHTTSTAGMGEIAIAGESFRIGRASTSQTTMRGQIARLWIWRGVALSAGEVASLWAFGDDPSGAISILDRDGPLATRGPVDIDGETIGTWGASQVALGYDGTAMTADGGNGWGAAVQGDLTNLTPCLDQENATYWTSGAGAVLTRRVQGPDGFYNAINVHHASGGPTTDYLALALVALGAGNPTMIWYYRNPSGAANTIKVELVSSAGTVIDTYSFTATTRTTWVRVAHTFTWTNPTATGTFRFYATGGATAGDIVVSPKIYVGQIGAAGSTQIQPIALALDAVNGTIGSVSQASRLTASPTMSAQYNGDGEIYAEFALTASGPAAGTILNLRQTSNDNDRRRLHIGAAGRVDLAHYDGAAASTSGNTPVATFATVTAQRGRWARIGLWPTPASFSEVRNAAGAAAGRTAIWTPGTVAPTRIEIGHAAGASEISGLVRRVIVATGPLNPTTYTGGA
jgi:hypothetical protein